MYMEIVRYALSEQYVHLRVTVQESCNNYELSGISSTIRTHTIFKYPSARQGRGVKAVTNSSMLCCSSGWYLTCGAPVCIWCMLRVCCICAGVCIQCLLLMDAMCSIIHVNVEDTYSTGHLLEAHSLHLLWSHPFWYCCCLLMMLPRRPSCDHR